MICVFDLRFICVGQSKIEKLATKITKYQTFTTFPFLILGLKPKKETKLVHSNLGDLKFYLVVILCGRNYYMYISANKNK